MPRITGNLFTNSKTTSTIGADGAFYSYTASGGSRSEGGITSYLGSVGFDSGLVTPTTNKVQPRAYGVLACVYLGTSAK